MTQTEILNIIKTEILEKHNYRTIKLNKTMLNKIIRWTSSKYNEYTKEEMIQDLLYKISHNSINLWQYSCGSYAEGNHNSGNHYIFFAIPKSNEYYLICRYRMYIDQIYRFKL